VRILVTNDDGVHAPGLAAVTRALATWSAAGSGGSPRHLVVAAPLVNHSGAGAAVGTVFERDAVDYRMVAIPGAENVPAFGVDASPALAVILGVLGAFGPPPDLIVSGINLGVNIGRSILHSGTVGAVLTGAQMGTSGLAVSLRSDGEQHHWETAAAVAVSLLDVLARAPERTVFNLNVPSLPLDSLRGIRRGHTSTADVVKAVSRADQGGIPGESGGRIVLAHGTAVPALGDVGDEAPDEDGALVAAGYASLTTLIGVHEDRGGDADDLVEQALARAQQDLLHG
jgi:5'-nucleotidase